MSGALVHRGPDSAGERLHGPVLLAARRLAIIALAHGDQPIATEDGAVIVVQNGEIYNHQRLAADLRTRGHRFATRCDTEVIGHLYEEHGLDAFSQLRGMFAIAIWVARARRLVLARDRFGIKPLFHARLRDGALAFASELSALAAELRERLRDSVRAHLVADVEVGVLLSGGIDSSALTALAAQESTRPVQTFSIGFEERSFDELEQARLIARRYGTEHHELVVRPDTAELLPEIVRAADEPLGDSPALPTYLISRLAAELVKVVLSGEGGDELFGGYETYAADLLAARIGPAARALLPLIERLPSGNARVPLDYKLKRFARAAHLPARTGAPERTGRARRRRSAADTRPPCFGRGGPLASALGLMSLSLWLDGPTRSIPEAPS